MGITDPDSNIDTDQHGKLNVMDREMWEKLKDETKHRHEDRKINILLALLGDFNSADVVTKGKHINERNPTKLVKKLQKELAQQLRDSGEPQRPISVENELRPALLARFRFTDPTFNKRKRLEEMEVNSFDMDKHIELVRIIQAELQAKEAKLTPLQKESKTCKRPWRDARIQLLRLVKWIIQTLEKIARQGLRNRGMDMEKYTKWQSATDRLDRLWINALDEQLDDSEQSEAERTKSRAVFVAPANNNKRESFQWHELPEHLVDPRSMIPVNPHEVLKWATEYIHGALDTWIAEGAILKDFKTSEFTAQPNTARRALRAELLVKTPPNDATKAGKAPGSTATQPPNRRPVATPTVNTVNAITLPTQQPSGWTDEGRTHRCSGMSHLIKEFTEHQYLASREPVDAQLAAAAETVIRIRKAINRAGGAGLANVDWSRRRQELPRRTESGRYRHS